MFDPVMVLEYDFVLGSLDLGLKSDHENDLETECFLDPATDSVNRLSHFVDALAVDSMMMAVEKCLFEIDYQESNFDSEHSEHCLKEFANQGLDTVD